MSVTVRDLRAFFAMHNAKMAFDGHGPWETVVVPAHYEVAGRGNVSWLRHTPEHDFSGAVLLLSQDTTTGAVRLMMRSDQIIIAHPEMRTLVANMLRKFYSDRQGIFRTANNARVHSTVQIIGGQNYEWIGDRWEQFPEVGAVSIGPEAEVEPFATIARGTMGNTAIGKGCRIGPHVNIGHDCRIGPDTIIGAHASLAGWVRVGRRVKIGQGALIESDVSIGDGAVVEAGAVVTKDVQASA